MRKNQQRSTLNISVNNGCTRRHSRPNSNINRTLKHRFSRHIDEAVLQTEHFLDITAYGSFQIATVGLFPKLHLASDNCIDSQFQIIKVLLDPALIDEPAKPVRILAVRIMKMIFDVVGVVGLAFFCQRIKIEVGKPLQYQCQVSAAERISFSADCMLSVCSYICS